MPLENCLDFQRVTRYIIFVEILSNLFHSRHSADAARHSMSLRTSTRVAGLLWETIMELTEKDVRRFMEKINVPYDLFACWEWTAATDKDGYGYFRLDKKHDRGHRVMWKWKVGPIPQGLSVLHSCDNPPCVNPAHLFLGTQHDNMADRDKKGRSRSTKRTHCPQGHIYSGDNLHLTPNGERMCKTCSREKSKQYYFDKKQAINEKRRMKYRDIISQRVNQPPPR